MGIVGIPGCFLLSLAWVVALIPLLAAAHDTGDWVGTIVTASIQIAGVGSIFWAFRDDIKEG